VPPTIVVEVLNAHHMIITFFHIPAPGMRSPERFFWKGGWKKEMVSDICWAAGPKAVEVRRPELHFFQRNADFLVLLLCFFVLVRRSRVQKNAPKKTQFIPQKKHKKKTIHTYRKKTQKETQFIPQKKPKKKQKKNIHTTKKNKKHTIHTTKKQKRHNSYHTKQQKKTTIHTTKKHNSYHKKHPKKTQFISQKKTQKNTMHTTKSKKKHTQIIPQKNH
jgi:hypothetical protein